MTKSQVLKFIVQELKAQAEEEQEVLEEEEVIKITTKRLAGSVD